MITKPLNKTNTIYVDVDDTLHIDGVENKSLFKWCRDRKREGCVLILWSARGATHARLIAEGCGIDDVFKYILSKPTHIVDDKGITWLRFVKNLGIHL